MFSDPLGAIRYWITKEFDESRITLVFLPGLTANHRLFTKQISYFKAHYNVFVWDAPGHNSNTDKPKEINQLIEQFVKVLDGDCE